MPVIEFTRILMEAKLKKNPLLKFGEKDNMMFSKSSWQKRKRNGFSKDWSLEAADAVFIIIQYPRQRVPTRFLSFTEETIIILRQIR
jgi:hypothetical protein